MVAPTFLDVEVDVWTLRCIYRLARYKQRLEAGEFIVERGKARKAHNDYHLGPGGISIEVYYIDRQTKIQVARVHQLERADGTLGGGGEPDPKDLVQDGVHYHQYSGGKWWHKILRDPSILCPGRPTHERPTSGVIYQAYKAWRKIKCDRWGK